MPEEIKIKPVIVEDDGINKIKPVVVKNDGINKIKPVVVEDDGVNKVKKKSSVSRSPWEAIIPSVVPSVKEEQQPSASSSVKKADALVDLNKGTEKGEIYKGLPIKGFEDKSYVLKNVDGIDVWQEYNPKNKDVVIGKANKYLSLSKEGVAEGGLSGGEKQKNAKLALTQLAEKIGVEVSSTDGPDDIYQKIQSSKELGETYKNITDPTRIKTLNQNFKAQASTNEGVQTYVGYPEKGKEDNEYRISKLPITKEQVWEVKRKGQKEFTVISDEGSINALNNWTGNKVESNDDAKAKRDAQIARQESAVNNFKLVNSKMFDLAEEDAVPYLQKMYGKYGFNFSENGLLGKDEVTATASNGERINLSLDNWSEGADASESAKLRRWMIENQSTNDYIDKEREAVKQAEDDYRNSKYEQEKLTPEQIKLQSTSDLQRPIISNPLDAKNKLSAPAEFNQEIAANTIMTNKINAQRRLSDLSNNAKTQKQKDEVATIAVANQNVLKQEADVQATYLNDLSKQNKQLNNSVLKLKQDSERFYNGLKQQGITPEQLNTDPELLRQKQELDERAKNIEVVSKNISADMSAVKALNKENEKNAGLYIAFNENRGNVMGGLVNSVLKGVGALPDAILNNISDGDNNFASNALISLLGSDYTTDEFMKSEDRWDLTKAAFGGLESLGAMAAGSGLGKIVGGGSKLMAISEELPFFAMSYNELKSEMKGPEWDRATTAEKEGLALIYAYINGKLEKLGTDALIDTGKISKDVSKNLILKTIAGLKPGATTEAMDLALQTNFKKFILSSAYTLGKDFTSEAKTGAMQELTGITLKNTYNLIKGKEMFKEVPNTIADITDAVISGAYMEGLGGLAFSMPKVAVDAGKFGYSKAFKDPEKLAFAEKIFNDSDMRVMILNDLKTKIASGEITKEEGQERVDAINNTISLFEKLPDGIREEDKPKTLDLLVEKSKLEQDIKGKDEALTVPQKERITEINNELTNISKNATKEGNITESNLTERENGNESGKTAETSGSDSTVESGENQKEVEKLRADERAELAEAIPNIDDYKVDGEIDKEKIKASKDGAKYQEIYDKYDKLITPLLPKTKSIEGVNEGAIFDEKDKERIDKINESLKSFDLNNLSEEDLNKIESLQKERIDIESKYGINDLELKHGTPYDFSKFELEKIGTGEGAQAFGYGLYFTENDNIAKSYAKKLSEDKKGIVYTVKIKNGKLNNWLEWREPISSEQATALSKALKTKKEKYNKYLSNIENENPYTGAAEELFNDNIELDELNPIQNSALYNDLVDAFGQEEASSIMKEAGIDGVKYNTKGGKGNDFNYVIFNHDSIEIVEKKKPSKQPTTLEEAKSLDTSDPTNLKKVQSFLDNAISQLDTFGKETLGMNLPVAVAKVVLKTVKKLVDAGVSLEQAFKQAAETHDVKEIDILDTIESLQNKQKESEASKAAKDISKKDNTKVTVNERTALKDQLRLEAKAARESAMNIKKKQRALADSIKAMAKAGKITASQSANLLRRLAYLNIDNEATTQEFLDYAERLFANAEYSDKVDKGFKAKAKIKAKLKSKNQAQVTQVAKDFATIDPSIVTDIDKYNEMADAMLAAIAPSVSGVKQVDEIDKINEAEQAELKKEIPNIDKYKTNGKVDVEKIKNENDRAKYNEIREKYKKLKYEANNKLKTPIVIADVQDYVDKALEAQKEIERQALLSYYKKLVEAGILNDKMSIEEIREVVANENNDDDKLSAKEREKIVRDDLNKRFEVAKSAIEDIIDTDDSISKDDREVLKKMMSLDLNDMSIKDAMSLIDSANNFIVNGITAGLKNDVAGQIGNLNAKKKKQEGVVAKSIGLLRGFGTSMKNIGSVYATQILHPNMLANTLFGSKGPEMMRAIGYDKLSSGVTKATIQAKKILNDYQKKFIKTKPNGVRFKTTFNRYERGMYASLIRNVIGTDADKKATFKRNLDEIFHSTEKLLNSGDATKVRKGKVYQELINKLGLADKDVSIESVKAKVDPINVDAVNYMVDVWNDFYNDLYDLSLSIYNTQLDKEDNYTPRRKSKLDLGLKEGDLLEGTGSFSEFLNLRNADKDKSGVLKEANKSLSGKNRYQDFDFDGNNKDGLEAALMDIYTAEAIREIEGFIKSEHFKSIIPVADTRSRFERKLTRYINIKKGRREIQDQDASNAERLFTLVSKFVTGRTLGTISAAPAQFIAPALNTLINTGRLDFNDAMNQDAKDWMDREGVSVRMRGAENFDSINRHNEKRIRDAWEKSGIDAALSASEKWFDFWLKNFLVKSDKAVAVVSWFSYYKKSLKEQGLSTDIDWKNHQKNDKAFAYANSMIDKNQNASDSESLGNLYSTSNPVIRVMRNGWMPYSSFIMNQKARMHEDAVNMFDADEKKINIDSMRSLFAGAAEMMAFHAVQKSIKLFLLYGIANLILDDEDEEALNKMVKDIKDDIVSSILTDAFSPAPIANKYVLDGANYLIGKSTEKELTDDVLEKEYEKDKESRILKGKDKISFEQFKKDYIANEIDKNTFYNPDNNGFGGIYEGGSKMVNQMTDLYNLAYNKKVSIKKPDGTYIEKYVDDNVSKAGKIAFFMTLAHDAGVLPGEASTISRMVLKKAKAQSVNKNIKQVAADFKKELGLKELAAYQKDMIKSGTSLDTMIKKEYEIALVGGLKTAQKQESFKKIVDALGSNFDVQEVIMQINSGKSSKEIINKLKDRLLNENKIEEKVSEINNKVKNIEKKIMIETIKNSRK